MLDLVPTALVPDGALLYPVGRLDQDSEGMLLLTNDGAWADRVLHPRHGVEREYAIGLERPLGDDQVAALQAGIRLEEGRATVGGLRAMTQIEVERLGAPAPTDPARAGLVPGDTDAGLETAVATDVRRDRRPGRAPRTRPDRPGAHRWPPQRRDPASQGTGDAWPGSRRRALAVRAATRPGKE